MNIDIDKETSRQIRALHHEVSELKRRGASAAFLSLTGLPTTLDGYGITDAVHKTGDDMTGALTISAVAGNTFVVDSTTLVVDATNNRVGIGTAAPATPLHVVGATQTSGTAVSLFRVESSNEGGSFDISDGSSAGFLPSMRATSAGVNGSGGVFVGAIPSGNDSLVAAGAALAFNARRSDNTALVTANAFVFSNFATPLMTIPAAGGLDISTATGPVLTLRRVDTSIAANDSIGKIQFYAKDTSTTTNMIVADIEAQATNTLSSDANPGRLIFRTTSAVVADAAPTERLRIDQVGDFTFFDGADFILGTTTGTKIGTATTQKLGFWNATPIVRPTLTAYTSDSESVAYTGAADGEAKLADLNALRVAYETLRAAHDDLRTKLITTGIIA